MVISTDIHMAFDSGEIQALRYVTRYATVDIKHTVEGLVVVVVNNAERYFYLSLVEASNMLYSLGVMVVHNI